MQIFALIALILMTSTAFSTEIKGLVLKDTTSLPSTAGYSITHDDAFPKKHYDIYDLVIYRSTDSLTLNSGVKIKSNTYQLMDTFCTLDLVKYDKKTGYYKFKLSIKVKSLVDMNPATSYDPISINDSLLFKEMHKPEMYIEGKVDFVNNRPVLNNLNTNENAFSLVYRPPPINHLILTALRDIPITVNLN